MATIKEGLLYAKSHEWVKVEGEFAIIGISDFAQEELGDISYVDFPEAGDEISAGDVFGAIESVKAASDLYSPVSGTVEEINEELEDSPEKVNEAPYDAWIIKIKMSSPAELESLLDAAAYKEICE